MARPHIQVLVDWDNDGDFDDAGEDITADVQELSLEHVRDLQSEYMNTAVLDLTLKNDGHKYSPPNSASPLAGSLEPGRAIWARLFYPYDGFDGTAGVFLHNHGPDEDSAWAWASRSPAIASNAFFALTGDGRVQADSGSAEQLAYLDFDDTDVDIAARYRRGTDTSDHGGLTWRSVDDDNYGYIRVTGSAIEVRKKVSGAHSTITSASHAWSTNTAKLLQARLHGDRLWVYVDNAVVIDGLDVSDGAIDGGTRHGLYLDGPADHSWDYFGGYKSLFHGMIDRFRPRPMSGAQYCYVKAFDAFEGFKRRQVRFKNYTESGASEFERAYRAGVLTPGGITLASIADDGETLVQDGASGSDVPYAGLKATVGDALTLTYRYQDEEDGFLYIDGQGCLRFESRSHRSGAPHTSARATLRDSYDGSDAAFVDMAYDDGQDHVENSIVMSVSRATHNSGDTVVWTAHQADGVVSIPFDADEVKDFIAEADFDSVQDYTPPVATTDYTANAASDGSGADQTGAITVEMVDLLRYWGRYARVRVTWGGTAGYLTFLQLRGKSLSHNKPTEAPAEDANSIAAHGMRRRTIDCLWIDRDDAAREAVQSRLARRKSPRTVLELTLAAGDAPTLHNMVQRRISDRVTVVYADMDIDDDYFIEGETWRMEQGGPVLRQTLQLRRA